MFLLSLRIFFSIFFFFFNDTATTEIYTLSLHDALPISGDLVRGWRPPLPRLAHHGKRRGHRRSEEHTSELQSRGHLVCRLLLAKKKNQDPSPETTHKNIKATIHD